MADEVGRWTMRLDTDLIRWEGETPATTGVIVLLETLFLPVVLYAPYGVQPLRDGLGGLQVFSTEQDARVAAARAGERSAGDGEQR